MNIVTLRTGQRVQFKPFKKAGRWMGTVTSFGDGWVRVLREDNGKAMTIRPHQLREAA
jgi:hypothetical protein